MWVTSGIFEFSYNYEIVTKLTSINYYEKVPGEANLATASNWIMYL